MQGLPCHRVPVTRPFSSAIFPDRLKPALVSPCSNIILISKVIERVIAQQLKNHLFNNGLHDNLQSAYKSDTSTETAILRIKADIEEVLDEGDAILLVLLDLSAAFDTIDHSLVRETAKRGWSDGISILLDAVISQWPNSGSKNQ